MCQENYIFLRCSPVTSQFQEFYKPVSQQAMRAKGRAMRAMRAMRVM